MLRVRWLTWLCAALLSALPVANGAMAREDVGGELVVYSAPGVSALFEALVEPFAQYTQNKFGVAVKVDIVTRSVPVAWTMLQTEWPNPSGDVYLLYAEHMAEGIRRGYLQPLRPHYSDAEWTRFDPEAMRALDADGYAAPFIMTAIVLAVQSSLAEDAVTGWTDLSGDALKGRFTFDSAMSVGAGYSAVAAAALVQGSDWHDWFKDGRFDEAAARPTLELMRHWAGNALTMTQGSGTIRPLLARGEALASAWWWANTMQEIRDGLPLRIVYPKEGTVTAVQPGPVVTSVTKNPLAAIEWVKFVHSDFSAQVSRKLNYLARIPLTGEDPPPEWKEFTAKAKQVPIDRFRASVLDPAYKEAFIDAYRRIVLQQQ